MNTSEHDAVDVTGLATQWAIAADHQRVAIEASVVETCGPMVHAIARRFAHRTEDLADLQQVGHIAVLGALRRFDAETGTNFRAYAATCVAGAIRNHFRDNTWSMKVSRTDKELAAAYWSLCERSSGADVPLADAAAELGCEADALARALSASTAWRVDSTDSSAEDSEAGVDVADPWVDTAANATSGVLTEELLASLDHHERTLVWGRVVDDRPQSEIAAMLGLTPMQASRKFHAAMAKLRERAAEIGLGPSI